MKKIIVIIFSLIFLSIFNQIYAMPKDNIIIDKQNVEDILQNSELEKFLNQINTYTNEYFPELNNKEYVDSLIKGENIKDVNFLEKIIKIILGEFQKNIYLIFKIMVIAILCTLLKNMQNNFSEKGVSEIAFYVCYLVIITILITSFKEILVLCTETVEKLSNFMNMLMPLVLGLMGITGKLKSVSLLQPMILGITTIIGLLLNKIILPIINLATIIQIITNISNTFKLDTLAEFLKKISFKIIEISFLIFTCILSLEGTLGASMDGITSKLAKNFVSNSIPVVGKILGDTVNSVIGGITISKNIIGFVGVIVIFLIAMVPLIKSGIILIIFEITSGLIEPITDQRISKSINGVIGSIKILVGILAIISFVFVIAIAIMLKISNQILMYS